MEDQELNTILWYLGFVVLALVLAFLLLFFVLIAYVKLTCGKCHSYRVMKGKTILITGANRGIGQATVLDLAMRDARIIMACRDVKAGNQAAMEISRRTGNKKILVRYLNISCLHSVRQFAEKFIKEEQRLDVLIHNAGIVDSSRVLTADDIETTLATNYIGPFLLTQLLLDLLKQSAPSRIINVSSEAHRLGKIDFTNFNYEKRYSGFAAYCNSKLAQVLFTKELAERLQGTGVTVNCLHPGFVKTSGIDGVSWYIRWPLVVASWFFSKTPHQGAQTTIYLAVMENLEDTTGKYFKDCKIAKESPKANDKQVSKRLWDISLQLSQQPA